MAFGKKKPVGKHAAHANTVQPTTESASNNACATFSDSTQPAQTTSGTSQAGGYVPVSVAGSAPGGAYRAQGRASNATSEFVSQAQVISHKRRSNRGKKIAIGIVCGIFALCIGAGTGLALWFNNLNNSMQMSDEDLEALEAVLVTTEEDEPYYVLLLGSDAREEDTASRSDTIILARVDPETATATLVSIPRDTKIELEGHGTQKINAAYAYGGASGAVEAVSDFAGVDISYYAEIHFEELITLVDELGGIEVDVPVSNTQTGSTKSDIIIEEGLQTMDGETALAFARERYGYTDGDFQRSENQRLVIEAIVNKVLDKSAAEIPDVVESLAACVSTNYSVSELVNLALDFQSADGGMTLYSAGVPSTTQTIDGVSYVITTEDEWAEMMALVDAGEDPNGTDDEEESNSSDDTSDDVSEDTE